MSLSLSYRDCLYARKFVQLPLINAYQSINSTIYIRSFLTRLYVTSVYDSVCAHYDCDY